MKRKGCVSGFTLVELIVALAIIAIMLGVVTGSILSSADPDADGDPWREELDDARRRSIRSGGRIVVWPDSAHEVSPVLLLPDGRAVGLPEDNP